jgi:hypothetical protein
MIPLPGVQETDHFGRTRLRQADRAPGGTEFLSVRRRGGGDRPQFGINPRLFFFQIQFLSCLVVYFLPPQLPSCLPHAVAAVRREWIPRWGRVKPTSFVSHYLPWQISLRRIGRNTKIKKNTIFPPNVI